MVTMKPDYSREVYVVLSTALNPRAEERWVSVDDLPRTLHSLEAEYKFDGLRLEIYSDTRSDD